MNEATDVLDPEPVFVDPSGRRRRIVRRAGIALGCLLAAYLVIVAFGLVTGARAPLTPWPDVKPSARNALPGHGAPVTRRERSRPATPTPTPTPRPSSRAGASPTARSSPTTRRTPPSSTTTRPGKGRAYGVTKSPNPKKP